MRAALRAVTICSAKLPFDSFECRLPTIMTMKVYPAVPEWFCMVVDKKWASARGFRLYEVGMNFLLRIFSKNLGACLMMIGRVY